ncbi:TrbG/VirB9 family P-type conjugative transfer protein [Wolbachia endosymbiont of Howardula sp.]|nr:TrbG/VirB9 family P-type conjugative transfer protein [Wolbachia endosymbiont of Howardula sp.]UWI83403.1 TrbG/VirB9 family P-type conjugative transfer protein [Wolbachia endosymbiont of Howardula sp.]
MLHIIIYLFYFCSYATFAQQEARSIDTNHHIKIINYKAQSIHKYVGFYGYQSSMLFEQGEIIDTISMGDSTGWQLIPQGNRLFLKPIDDFANTNATIITNKRVYHFELYAENASGLDDARLAYEVRFIYPVCHNASSDIIYNNILNQSTEKTVIPDIYNPKIIEQGLNFNYYISHTKGSHAIIPIKIFDDGIFTYLQFHNIHSEFPAVFMKDHENNESLVNFRTIDNYLVIERIADFFILRHGSRVVLIFNNGDQSYKTYNTIPIMREKHK